eukprot:COSAG05_NODE_1342_length_5140_cov_2.897838_5_plen_84_part_00
MINGRPRYILSYISAQVQAAFPNNVMVKYAIAILNCCVACFERLVKYLTDTAFIQIAIWGTPFCESAIRGKLHFDSPSTPLRL